MGNVIFVLLIMLTGCTKGAILNHRDIYGNATINDLNMTDYLTLKESLTPELWYVNLPSKRLIVTEDSCCYIQTFLRKDKEENPFNYYMILIGIPVEDGFPILSKEYRISYDNRVDYGKRNRTFEDSKELEKLIADSSSMSYGIAGIHTPLSMGHYIPLSGKFSFDKYEATTNSYHISYAFETVKNLDMPDTLRYEIKGFLRIN